MNILTAISGIYGELRGYHRISIRNRVAANERLTREELAALTTTLFNEQVHRSIERFPQYAERVRTHCGSVPAPGEQVEPRTLPVWTRQDQRAFFDQQPRPADTAYTHQTSGSTSLPIWFYVTRESYEWRTAIMDRSYSWARAEEGQRSLHVWAAPQKRPSASQRIKRSIHLGLQRRVHYDGFQEMGEAQRMECIQLINRSRPVSVVGYAGMMVDIARTVRDHPGVLTHKPATMVSAAEGLQPGQREFLETHLVGTVFGSYGSREFMSVGMECEHHTGYHLATDNLLVEVVDDDGVPVAPGETGRIVITDLHNAATPFIRYEIGDYGVLAPGDEQCPCGRPFPLLRSVDGRLQDVVRTPEGGKVTGLYVTFTMRQFGWIGGWQVIQNEPDRITVRLLTEVDLTEERTGPVSDLLRRKLGDTMTIEYERVNELTRRATGKVALIMTTLGDE